VKIDDWIRRFASIFRYFAIFFTWASSTFKVEQQELGDACGILYFRSCFRGGSFDSLTLQFDFTTGIMMSSSAVDHGFRIIKTIPSSTHVQSPRFLSMACLASASITHSSRCSMCLFQATRGRSNADLWIDEETKYATMSAGDVFTGSCGEFMEPLTSGSLFHLEKTKPPLSVAIVEPRSDTSIAHHEVWSQKLLCIPLAWNRVLDEGCSHRRNRFH
jgi:hypothetical protein